MKKDLYSNIRTELRRYENVKYFTRSFFLDYVKAYKTMLFNLKNEIDDSYEKDGMILHHAYDAIYASDFYNKTSCGYCAFLEIAYRERKKILEL